MKIIPVFGNSPTDQTPRRTFAINDSNNEELCILLYFADNSIYLDRKAM